MRVLLTSVCCDAGASAAHSLAHAGHEVIGVDIHAVPRWARSRYLSAYHAVPGESPATMGRGLVEILRRQGADVLIPVGTQFLRAALGERVALEALTAMNVPSDDAFSSAYDKRRCSAICLAAGVPCAVALTREKAMALLARPGNYGVVVKPAADIGASRGMQLVREPDALDAALSACEQHYGAAVLQEFIPGSPSAMRALTVLFDKSGALVAAFAMQKRQQHPAVGGVTVSGRSIPAEPLLASVRRFFEATGWTGPAEVEFKRDPRDGLDKVIEINPRFPGYLRFPVALGVDFPRLTAESAHGTVSGSLPSYPTGAVHVAPGLLARSLREADGTMGWRGVLGVRVTDVLRAAPRLLDLLRDPLPALARTRRGQS